MARKRPYQIPEAWKKAEKQKVELVRCLPHAECRQAHQPIGKSQYISTLDLLRRGIIEESHSAWCSPIVLMPKPDGSLRFCNDFLGVNDINLFDAYLMPRVDKLIDRLGKVQYISTLRPDQRILAGTVGSLLPG